MIDMKKIKSLMITPNKSNIMYNRNFKKGSTMWKFTDYDKDSVVNGIDCAWRNPRKHDKGELNVNEAENEQDNNEDIRDAEELQKLYNKHGKFTNKEPKESSDDKKGGWSKYGTKKLTAEERDQVTIAAARREGIRTRLNQNLNPFANDYDLKGQRIRTMSQAFQSGLDTKYVQSVSKNKYLTERQKISALNREIDKHRQYQETERKSQYYKLMEQKAKARMTQAEYRKRMEGHGGYNLAISTPSHYAAGAQQHTNLNEFMISEYKEKPKKQMNAWWW